MMADDRNRLAYKENDAIAVLRWQTIGENPHTLFLHEGELIDIGRLESNDLSFPNKKVSRQHAVIVWRDSTFQIKDLYSRNGTYVNQEKISDFHKLSDGDVIQIDIETIYFYDISSQESEVEQPISDEDTIIVPKKNAQPRLLVGSGHQEGKQIVLHSDKMVIGRSSPKEVWDINLQDRAISRPQAEIFREGSKILIADLDSANGTMVNAKWITEPVELVNGDLIELGETTLVFRDR
jgi:pSer/pThr/pTyr-binding forkhead associated (FHA) protein